MRGALVGTFVAVLIVTTACSDEPLADPKEPVPATTTATHPDPTSPTTGSRRFDGGRAFGDVRELAGDIGPRLATGPAFREAAAYVGRELAAQGYDVRRQRFGVPAGDSWGVPVEAGRSMNVVATPGDFDPGAPYVLIGAHLDTVAVAPGAEDNASGVSVVLELARVLGGSGQVVLVAFGGEEPRGPGDLHHFGSKHYVATMTRPQRDNLRAMVALDRVGVGTAVPLSAVDGTPTRVRDELARTADRLRIPTVVETDSASDHESFADAGLPAARIGSTPYAAYHSAADVPSVVEAAQLRRVGRILTAWLRDR